MKSTLKNLESAAINAIRISIRFNNNNNTKEVFHRLSLFEQEHTLHSMFR